MFLLRDTTHRMLLQYDAAIGHRFVPGLRARVPSERGGYFVATNQAGFRSDVDFDPAPGRRPRILMFGDSYTAGDLCENPERFSDLLAADLDVEVYNYGVPGTGIDQSLLAYETYARDVAADLVVLCVHTDSIRRIQQRARASVDRTTGRAILVPKPFFTLEGDTLHLHQVPVPRERPESDGAARGSEGDSWVGRALDSYRHAPIWARARQALRTQWPEWQSTLYRAAGIQPYPDYASPDSPGWRLQEAILRRFIAAVQPRPVVIVPVPGYQYFLHGARPQYQRLFSRLATEDGASVRVVDITTPMQRLSWRERRQLSFEHDSHFSPRGHRVAADAIAPHVRDRLPVRSAATVPASAASTVPAVRPARAQYVLGLSAFYHDSAACLLRDGAIVAAAQEERFTRIKHDARFPRLAVNFCLEEAGIHARDLDAVVYHEHTPRALERILRTQVAAGASGEAVFAGAVPSWLRYKLRWPGLVRRELRYDGRILQTDHHRSHACSAFYPSPFERAAIVTMDGVGEWATASIGRGVGTDVTLARELHFPHSLGLLYSAFTQFTGFEVNEGEYKMMGLAPYGRPIYAQRILDSLVDLKADGSLALNMAYFAFLSEPSMINEAFGQLFDGPARDPRTPITRREMDIARSIQEVTEACMLRMARHAHTLTGERDLCLAGGVALNCVGNGRIMREGPFERVWIQPAAGDAGAALGAALDACHGYFETPRTIVPTSAQAGSLLGPSFSDAEIRAFLDTHGAVAEDTAAADVPSQAAQLLAEGRVVGYFNGRMEFGPRALGARSILGDPRNAETQVTLNVRIKYRESFRPFAPAVLAERASDYFEINQPSPYMLIVAPVVASRRLPLAADEGEDLLAIVRQARSDIPAITHVDYSARVQTVTAAHNPAFRTLIEAFADRTGVPVVVNTSFNVRGEPVVCTPYDAYRCFMRTEMDYLVLGPFLLDKRRQPTWPEPKADRDRPRHVVSTVDPLDPAVRAFFRDHLVPISTALGAAAGFPSGTGAASLWVDVSADRRHEDYEVPDALEGTTPPDAALTAAVTAGWRRDAAGRALIDVVPVLLALCQPSADAADPSAELPESVYVMF